MTNKAKLLFLNHSVDVLIININYPLDPISGMMALDLTCNVVDQLKITEGFVKCACVKLDYNCIEEDFFIEHFTVNKSKMFITIRQARKIKNLDFKVVFDAN